MSCDQAIQVQAYLDGELDAPAAVAVERHLEFCPDCAKLRADIEAIRRGMRESAAYHRAPESLRDRIHATLGRVAVPERSSRVLRSHPFWSGVASGAAAMALAASFVLFLLLPTSQDEVAHDVVAAHLRSLMGTHLIDVASSNRHVVKPWFEGRSDISPPVGDYALQGFALVGGRIDYVHGERAAVVVFRHGRHVVNVFAWKDDGAAHPGSRSLNGYHLLAWRSGNIFFCAVSDMATADLQSLSSLIRQTSSS